MTTSDWVTVVLAVLGALFGVIGTLLMLKVNRMDRDIEALETAHTIDVAALNDLKLSVSVTHPTKTDMTGMFERFKEYLDERFRVVEHIAAYSGSYNESERRNRVSRENDNV